MSPMVYCNQAQPGFVKVRVELILQGYICLVCSSTAVKRFCNYYAAHGQLDMNSRILKKRNLLLRLYILITPAIFLQSFLNGFGNC